MTLNVNPFTAKFTNTIGSNQSSGQKNYFSGQDTVSLSYAPPRKKNSLAGDLLSGAIVGATLGTYGPGPFIFPYMYNPFYSSFYNPFFYNPFRFGGGFGYMNPFFYGGYSPFGWV